MRKTGYYWVKFEGSKIWEMGRYDASTLKWTLMDTITQWTDKEFIEIDESEIQQPNETRDGN